ncbi:MAG: ABC transporter permease [Acidisphaera sp.]|nr:ABC transporter permease [Acidisphaera sp.]
MRLLRLLLVLYCVGVFGFLILPLLIVVPVSFSAGAYLQFPPPGWSLRWYRMYFSDPQWLDATWLSLRVAAVTVLLSVTLGSAAALALVRLPFPGIGLLRAILMMPLVVPSIVLAIAVYSVYVRLHLVGSFWGIVLAHTILALPFAVVLMVAGLQRVDRRLEEASYTMGASAARTFLKVTFPIVRPSLFAAAVFAFITSWDEVILMLFIGGSAGTTLPLRMFSFLRTEINPVIAAVSTLLLLLAALVFGLSEWMKRRSVVRALP